MTEQLKLGDKVLLRGKIVAVALDGKNPYLFRYGEKPGDSIFVPRDAPFCPDPDNTKDKEIEQLQVQLAGCSVAANGGTSPDQLAKQGDYGWSVAYQDVLGLRLKYDEAKKRLDYLDSTKSTRLEQHACFVKGDKVKSKNSLLTGTFRKYNKDGKCVVKLDEYRTVIVDAFKSKNGYSLFDEENLSLVWRDAFPKYKESKSFTGLRDYVTTGNRRFSKGDPVMCISGSIRAEGVFIKYYKGKKLSISKKTRCLFRPNTNNLVETIYSKRGYWIVYESNLFLLSEAIK